MSVRASSTKQQIKQCLLNGIKTFLHYRKTYGFARFF